MDGFEATKQIIRMKKEGFVKADLPIIALTANAMEGDREKCLKVGMDDYLSKPVRSKDLIEKIVYWSGKKKNYAGTGGKAENQVHSDVHTDSNLKTFKVPNNRSGIVDEKAVKESKAIFKSKYKTILDYFMEDAENYIHQMQDAIKQDTPMDIIRPAHTLKSTSKRMGAIRLSDAAFTIEKIAKSLEDSENATEMANLKKQVDEMFFIFEATKSHFQQNNTGEQ